MLRMKRGALIASTISMVAILLSSCQQPYSQAPVVTNTPINPNSLFATPIISNPTKLSDTQVSGTQTAQVANPNVLNTPTSQFPTPTLTPLLPTFPTLSPTATLAVPGGSTVTPPAPPQQVPPGSRPPTWTLQREEFPYCIARRFDVHPNRLLEINNLTSPDVYYAGSQLAIPQTGNWPVADFGPRSLRNHPASYTVTGNADLTVYGVACKFGDVYPDAIVGANAGITLNSVLTIGKTLNIP